MTAPQPEQQPESPTEQAINGAESTLAAVLIAVVMAQIAGAIKHKFTSLSSKPAAIAYYVADALSFFKPATPKTSRASRLATSGLTMTLLPTTVFAVNEVVKDAGGDLDTEEVRAIADKSTERAAALAADKFDADYIDSIPDEEAGDRVQRTAKLTARWMAREAVFDAQSEAAARTGMTKKIWVTERDARVRDSHALLDGVEIGITESFVTQSGEIKYPGDITAPLNEVINCRCSLRFAK